MLISIFASVGSENLGDELILKNEVELLRMEYIEKNPKFIVFSYDLKNPFYKRDYIEYKPYFPINIKDYKNIFTNIKNFLIFLFFVIKSDLIIIGGGGLFFDSEIGNKKNPLNLWIFRRTIFNLFLKKVSFFRVGISIKKNDNIQKIEKIFKKSSYISVRDNYSFNILKNLGVKSEIKKDPVFFDKGEEITKKSIIGKIDSINFDFTKLKNFDFEGKKIGIAFRKGYLVEKSNMSDRLEEGKLREIINYIVSSGGEVALLPHSFHKNDSLSNDYLFLKKFLGKGVEIKNSMTEVYDVYKNKKIDICLSMRLHSIILSHVYEIPFIGISYSKKTDEILRILK